FEGGPVALSHAVDHSQTESRAAFALGGEKRLQAAAPRFLVHADARIGDFELHPVFGATLWSTDLARAGANFDGATLGHRVHGVENEVGQSVAYLTVGAANLGEPGSEHRFQLDHDAAPLRLIAPTCACELHDLLYELVEINIVVVHLRFAWAVEFAHARHGLGHII